MSEGDSSSVTLGVEWGHHCCPPNRRNQIVGMPVVHGGTGQVFTFLDTSSLVKCHDHYRWI